MSALLTPPESVPLKKNADGVILVAGTRVTLDTVVAAFDEGATAEEIAQQYPSLALSEVYAVLAHFLRNRDAVSEYLAERSKKAEAVRASHPLRLDGAELRKRLLARRKD